MWKIDFSNTKFSIDIMGSITLVALINRGGESKVIFFFDGPDF
jgi:hypothetical protein